MHIHFEVYLHAILIVDKNSWKLPQERFSSQFQYVRQSFENFNSKVLSINSSKNIS